jgi:hypothetical protein
MSRLSLLDQIVKQEPMANDEVNEEVEEDKKASPPRRVARKRAVKEQQADEPEELEDVRAVKLQRTRGKRGSKRAQSARSPVRVKKEKLVEAKEEDVEQFKIEKVLAVREHRRKKQYLVKWEGYASNDLDWIPIENFNTENGTEKEVDEIVEFRRLQGQSLNSKALTFVKKMGLNGKKFNSGKEAIEFMGRLYVFCTLLIQAQALYWERLGVLDEEQVAKYVGKESVVGELDINCIFWEYGRRTCFFQLHVRLMLDRSYADNWTVDYGDREDNLKQPQELFSEVNEKPIVWSKISETVRQDVLFSVICFSHFRPATFLDFRKHKKLPDSSSCFLKVSDLYNFERFGRKR